MVHIDDGRVLGSTSVFVRLTQLVGPVTESSNGFGVHACSSLCNIIYIVSVFGTIRGISYIANQPTIFAPSSMLRFLLCLSNCGLNKTYLRLISVECVEEC